MAKKKTKKAKKKSVKRAVSHATRQARRKAARKGPDGTKPKRIRKFTELESARFEAAEAKLEAAAQAMKAAQMLMAMAQENLKSVTVVIVGQGECSIGREEDGTLGMYEPIALPKRRAKAG